MGRDGGKVECRVERTLLIPNLCCNQSRKSNFPISGTIQHNTALCWGPRSGFKWISANLSKQYEMAICCWHSIPAFYYFPPQICLRRWGWLGLSKVPPQPWRIPVIGPVWNTAAAASCLALHISSPQTTLLPWSPQCNICKTTLFIR